MKEIKIAFQSNKYAEKSENFLFKVVLRKLRVKNINLNKNLISEYLAILIKFC